MLSPTTIWIAFALYMCFLLGVAVYVTVQDKKKAAGGSLLTASVKWPVLVMTYIASLMSTWVFFAGPGAYYRGGLGYWISDHRPLHDEQGVDHQPRDGRHVLHSRGLL